MRYLIAASLLLTSTLHAQTTDPRMDALASDLRTIARVASLAKDLGDVRQVLLAIVDEDVDRFREPRGDGTYRWASLQRQEASRVTDEKAIEYVHTEKMLREVTVTAPNAYRVVVRVPQKRSLVSANNRVFVRNVLVDSTGFDGKTIHSEIPVNAWIEPGDENGVALPEIGKSVKATAELGVESGSKKAVAEVGLLQAKLVDDPKSPWFPAVTSLLKVRELAAAKEIQRGMLKTTADEALLALPGEIDKRVAEQKTALAPGGGFDASPDTVLALQEIARMLGGTLDDQAAARAKLAEMLRALSIGP